MRFIAYLRVSTDEQADSGAGLAAQSDQCRQRADREGGEFVGPFTDDISGAATLDKRPQLLAAIAELRRGDVLLVAKRDRLARSAHFGNGRGCREEKGSARRFCCRRG